MILEALNWDHLAALDRQGVKEASGILDKPGYFAALIEHGEALAGIVPEGVVAAMGIVEQNPGNWRCWAVTDSYLTRRYFREVCRAQLLFLNTRKVRRIETVVMDGNERGERWVKNILGFKPVGLMHAFNEYGDAWLYERINGG